MEGGNLCVKWHLHCLSRWRKECFQDRISGIQNLTKCYLVLLDFQQKVSWISVAASRKERSPLTFGKSSFQQKDGLVGAHSQKQAENSLVDFAKTMFFVQRIPEVKCIKLFSITYVHTVPPAQIEKVTSVELHRLFTFQKLKSFLHSWHLSKCLKIFTRKYDRCVAMTLVADLSCFFLSRWLPNPEWVPRPLVPEGPGWRHHRPAQHHSEGRMRREQPQLLPLREHVSCLLLVLKLRFSATPFPWTSRCDQWPHRRKWVPWSLILDLHLRPMSMSAFTFTLRVLSCCPPTSLSTRARSCLWFCASCSLQVPIFEVCFCGKKTNISPQQNNFEALCFNYMTGRRKERKRFCDRVSAERQFVDSAGITHATFVFEKQLRFVGIKRIATTYDQLSTFSPITTPHSFRRGPRMPRHKGVLGSKPKNGKSDLGRIASLFSAQNNSYI